MAFTWLANFFKITLKFYLLLWSVYLYVTNDNGIYDSLSTNCKGGYRHSCIHKQTNLLIISPVITAIKWPQAKRFTLFIKVIDPYRKYTFSVNFHRFTQKLFFNISVYNMQLKFILPLRHPKPSFFSKNRRRLFLKGFSQSLPDG